jgi:hypothetical protein
MSSSETRKQLLYALRRILRPIVRILIRAGIRFDEFAELARGVYVETAVRDGIEHAAIPTRERVAVVTGVTRHQVDYYIDNEGALPLADPTLATVLVEILAKWHTDSQYVGPYGIPLELEFDSPASRCFRSLVAMVDRRISAGMALEELLRVGSVTRAGEKHFRAISRYFMMPESMSPEQIEYFGKTLPRLARTLEYNMNPKNPDKRLERFVVADRGLPADALPEFEKFARARTIEFLLELDNWLIPYASSELESAERINVGVNAFLYVEPTEDGESLASLVRKAEAGRRA